MQDDYEVRDSPWFLMSILLLIGGLALLFLVDFLWGIFCIAVAFFCYWRAHAGSVKSVVGDENPVQEE